MVTTQGSSLTLEAPHGRMLPPPPLPASWQWALQSAHVPPAPPEPSLACEPRRVHPGPSLGCARLEEDTSAHQPPGCGQGHLCRNSWKEENRR